MNYTEAYDSYRNLKSITMIEDGLLKFKTSKNIGVFFVESFNKSTFKEVLMLAKKHGLANHHRVYGFEATYHSDSVNFTRLEQTTWGAFDWHGSLMKTFGSEEAAWSYLDKCDMSGNVKALDSHNHNTQLQGENND